MPKPERTVVGDPVRLRALAHPIRLDLLERLLSDGPLTATQAGERIGQSSASASFHLRQLERYGFVEPVPDVAGRQKPWRLAIQTLSWYREDGTLAAESEETAGDLARTGAAVSTMLLQRAVADAGAWLERARDQHPDWLGAGEVTSRVRSLRPDQMKALVEEVGAVFDRFDEQVDRDAPDVRRVRIAFVGVPIEDEGG
jgi:DNA-binding transcriptional ArsR family regulator